MAIQGTPRPEMGKRCRKKLGHAPSCAQKPVRAPACKKGAIPRGPDSAGVEAAKHAFVRFYAQLNDLLPVGQRPSSWTKAARHIQTSTLMNSRLALTANGFTGGVSPHAAHKQEQNSEIGRSGTVIA